MALPSMPGRTSTPRAGLQGTQAPGASDAPQIEEWGDVELMPSLILIGKTGTGKTDAIGKLCEAGFNLAVLTVEDKRASLQRWKPLILDVNKIVGVDATSARLPTGAEKFQRLQSFQDDLRRGAHREYGSKTIDILAVDSLSEIADVMYAHLCTKYSSSDTLKMWMEIGTRTIDFFKGIRDAAGYAAAKLGSRPMGMVATVLEADLKKIDSKAGGYSILKNQVVLQGNMAVPKMVPAFEIAWRLSAGTELNGEHAFRVHTQKTDEFDAKSPPGIFETTVVGPGGIGNAPDVGEMYRELLTNEKSPFCRKSS